MTRIRPRRLRASDPLRRLARETLLSADDLVYPMFVMPGEGVRQEIPSMPGCLRLSADELLKEAAEVRDLGIPAVLLFGLPEAKDEVGSGAYDPDGIVQQAVRKLKSSVEGLLVVTDVCMCEYTSHGHCGVVQDGRVLNDRTLILLAKTAVSHAAAGADVVAPSDMMDARVGAIRDALDENGFQETAVMAYSAKYASAFYGPFREAAECAPRFGDRQAYQMDPANSREALKEVALDVEEGADIVMVKPALAYMDVIRLVKDATDLPVAAFNVSGEYSMVKAAAANGWIDERKIVLEILTSLKRAGADIILTYHAKDAARWMREARG
ncbi:MAG: porphobilinogen synthase [Armatimonadetes bacterium]|nr:porphobilinogen synthase [Armatimonadota bacterium]